jgi:murein DD-endopeptidase MepM/ murein hydrolase activator NlpD
MPIRKLFDEYRPRARGAAAAARAMSGRLSHLSAGRVILTAVAVLAGVGLVLESRLARSDEARRALAAQLDERWAETDPGAGVRVPRLADTVLVRGVVRSSFYETMETAAQRALPRAGRVEIAWRLADIFEYRVDMSRDLAPGDQLRLLLERSLRPDGSVYATKLLAARVTVAGAPIEAVRSSRGTYVDRRGRSLRATFLRAPLSFRRMSSPFGVRFHPILGRWREHRGIDYAADAGTPVRSVGDGTVIFAGWRGSYGNLVEIAHAGGLVTRYAHLRGYARSVRRGARVRAGTTIGYVGSTGLSTGPHLHFEMLVKGRYTDPRVALASRAAPPPRIVERTPYGGAQRAALLAALGG